MILGPDGKPITREDTTELARPCGTRFKLDAARIERTVNKTLEMMHMLRWRGYTLMLSVFSIVTNTLGQKRRANGGGDLWYRRMFNEWYLRRVREGLRDLHAGIGALLEQRRMSHGIEAS